MVVVSILPADHIGHGDLVYVFSIFCLINLISVLFLFFILEEIHEGSCYSLMNFNENNFYV